jgi:lipopolysaccharide export system ATP-binding protein
MTEQRTLRAHALRKRFARRWVVDGVSLEVGPGEIVGLLGPNGAGKTVTFEMLVGLIRPTSGRVLLDEQDITKLPMHERARHGIGYLAQERTIFRGLTVEENVAGVVEEQGIDKRTARERADRLLGEFGLTTLADERASVLSGGEQRRLEVARSLATEPRFLLFDEPFAGIDPLTIESLHAVMVELRERGLGVLLTDHNVRETLTLCNRAYVLFAGNVLAAGAPGDLMNHPDVRARFLGEDFDAQRMSLRGDDA